MNTEDFTSKVITVVIAVIVIAVVAIPIINGMIGTDVPESGTPGTDGYVAAKDYPIDADSPEAAIIKVIPIFLILAVLMTVVYMFMSGKKNGN